MGFSQTSIKARQKGSARCQEISNAPTGPLGTKVKVALPNSGAVASLVFFNLEAQELVNRLDVGFVGRGDDYTPTVESFLEGIMNCPPESFHFLNSRWNRVVDEDRNVKVSALKRLRDMR